MRRLLLFTLILFAGFFEVAKGQNISNEGADFWIPFPTHDPNGTANLANLNVFVTCKTNSEVTVSCGTYTETKPILANTIVTFSVPRANSYISNTEGNTVLTNRAIHVVTTAGKPNVAVYAHIYAGARSAASLILPKEALGQKYYSMNYTQDNGGRNFLVLVAVEDNTELIIHENAGATKSVTLPKAGDVYEYYPSTAVDLTGTFVEVNPATSQCKRFAAFSGSTSLIISCAGSRDPLFQQLYTISSWGKNYGVVPFIARRYILRILAQEDNTSVKINGVVAQTLNKGQYFETPQLTEAIIISADKLISVAQYSLTQGCSTIAGGNIIGDPEMVLLNPTEFNIKNITVFSSDNQAIQTKYVNVFMKTAKTSTFKLNGVAPSNGSWLLVPSDPTYSYIQIQVFTESLTLTADDGFNAIAYGFGSAESYAYSAGTSLASTQFLTLVNKVSKLESSSACVGQSADFKLTLPYLLNKLVWKFNDGSPDYIDSAPAPTTTIVNGETLYTYLAPVNKAFNTVGTTQILAVATLSASAGSCAGSDVEFTFNFNVDPLPTAEFTVATTGCASEEIAFKDNSTSNVTGKTINKWFWDFGDGTTSTVQNPKHIYTTSGNFNVKFYVDGENGCMSDVVTHDILINPKVTALFSANQNSCVNRDILFTNQATVDAGGTIVKWTWDMGDGKGTTVKTDGNPFTYQYATVGKYTVTLIAESDKGCVSMPYKLEVTANALPINDFLVPDVCLADAQAIFVNSSTDFDGTVPAGLTYLWNFGDATSGSLNTSTQRDGKHKYNASGNYTVSLTITNSNGCSVTLTKPFTVNGSFPKAEFEILNENSLCSNQTFSLKNNSTVDFGNVTKIEWYIDGVKTTEDLDPTSGKVYDFTYPQFTAPQTKTLVVKMIVYSGGTCSNEISKNVILLASPVVQFDALNPICLNGGLVQFAGKENGGLAGAYVYTGTGVSATGLFNPLIAGVGIHEITYTFTAGNGCTDSKIQSIEVYPLPTVDAGQDFYLLAGGEKQITAKATGANLTYKWTPAIGLSADDIINPIANPEQDTKYTLTVTTNEGCSLSDDVYIYVLQSVNAPNSFTPNGDGVNDLWNVKYLDTYPNGYVEIYDRNGQRVFYSKGYAVPFDGNYKNQPLPVGTYYYIINPNSGRKSITGTLTIIR